MIDTHCHLTFPQLYDQLDAVLARAHEAGVDRMITVGTSLTDSQRAAALAGCDQRVYATAGVHPHYAEQCPSDQSALFESLEALAHQPRVVALGEMGLDRHYDDPPMQVQRRVFQWQLEWASPRPQPIIIHNREATDDVLAMIRDSAIPASRFVFHCFTGSQQELDAILTLGAMVSFTGIVTFKNARSLTQSAQSVPLDRLMIETDSPYLTPEPYRKVRPNQPCYTPWIARHLARTRAMDEDQFVNQVDRNALRFFQLDARQD